MTAYTVDSLQVDLHDMVKTLDILTGIVMDLPYGEDEHEREQYDQAGALARIAFAHAKMIGQTVEAKYAAMKAGEAKEAEPEKEPA
jgi:hypothetical protein